MGVTYAKDHLLEFGTTVKEDKDLLSVYRKTIVERGPVRADIKMTCSKARFFIVYKPFRG